MEKREETLYEVIGDELRGMVQGMVNETIDIWMKGLGDGNDGRFPEFCVEFPYLRGKPNISPLTVVYVVDGGKAKRTEVLRVDLGEALMGGLRRGGWGCGSGQRLWGRRCGNWRGRLEGTS